jgi:DNA polymerase I-like protein with 3'-5' exonuclease and polymerase domains
MEVSFLQWLSGDPLLGQIIDSGEDLYSSIWTQLTGMKSNDAARDKSKAIFLPVVYGLGADGLAEKIGVAPNVAGKVIDRIYNKFSTAMKWIKAQQDHVSVHGVATDVLGRCRRFEDHEHYKIRNFCVQSPAALFCLAKLVQLHDDIKGRAKVGFHVHDGYVLFSPSYDVRQVGLAAKASLESELPMFPNLKLKVACKIGEDLNNLSNLL